MIRGPCCAHALRMAWTGISSVPGVVEGNLAGCGECFASPIGAQGTARAGTAGVVVWYVVVYIGSAEEGFPK